MNAMDGGPMENGGSPGKAHRRPAAVADPASDENLWVDAAGHFTRWRNDGTRSEFEELVRVLTPLLWHVVRAAGADDEQSRDILQSVWLTLIRNPGCVRDEMAVGKWLVVSARRESWRVVKRDRLVKPFDPAEVPERGSERSAEATALQATDNDILWRHVNGQNARCQRLLRVVAFLDQANYKSLAKELGLAPGSIGATRRRCLDALRQLIEQDAASHV